VIRRSFLIPIVVVAAAVTVPTAVAFAGQVTPRAATPAAAGLLWDGDAAKGTGVFDGLETAPGSITVADAAPFGKTFRYETWDNANGSKERCESRGTKGLLLNTSRLNQTYFVGWRAKWNPMPITRGRWIAFYQLHWSGAGPGGGPLVIRTLGDGNLYLQYVSPDGRTDRNIWKAPLSLNTWNSFVVSYRLAKDSTGFVEFWYNGQKQTFVNGQQRWTGAIFKGTHVNNKWGVYRSGPNSGHAVDWVNHPRIGTTLESVLPT
jgi:hypothetical protein